MSSTPMFMQQFDEERANGYDEISFVPEAELDRIVQAAGFATLTRVYQSLLWGAWWTHRD